MTASYLDIAFLAVLGLFSLRGLFRGLVEEVAGLVGVIGGFWLANKYHDALIPFLQSFLSDPAWINILSYVLVFLGVLLGVSIIARCIQHLLKISFVSWLDHLTGAVMGLAKGLLICSIVLALLQQFVPNASFVQESLVVPYLSQVIAWVREYLPQHLG